MQPPDRIPQLKFEPPSDEEVLFSSETFRSVPKAAS
jgi:hypothetical protein